MPACAGREDFGGWGDRFVQLGDWRLAAIDEGNFAFAHKNGKNVEVCVQGELQDVLCSTNSERI